MIRIWITLTHWFLFWISDHVQKINLLVLLFHRVGSMVSVESGKLMDEAKKDEAIAQGVATNVGVLC